MRPAFILVLTLSITICGDVMAARKALVIGIGDYKHFNDLSTPREDGRRFAEALEELGFQVHHPSGQDINSLKSAQEKFLRSLSLEDEAVYYFSGHGMQRGDDNFLFARDSNVDQRSSISSVNDNAVNVTFLLQEMEARAAVSVLFLDSCRTIQVPGNKSIGSAKGFTFKSVELAQRGASFVGFASMENTVAFTGDGPLSPFTSELVAALKSRELSRTPLPEFYAHVRRKVRDVTQGLQIPDRRNNLGERVFRFSNVVGAFPNLSATPGPNAVPGTSPATGEQVEAREYEAAERLDTVVAYERVSRRYPETIYAELARARIRKLTEPGTPDPERVFDASAVVLASGLRLSDWVMLAEKRLEAREYRGVLVEGMGHLREYGQHRSVDAVVERALEGLFAGTRVIDDESARSALRSMEQIREVVKERPELSRTEAEAHARLGRFSQAVEAYRSWLRLVPVDHPERREILVAMYRAERGERRPSIGERFHDCAECPELVVVPPGSYMMGSPSNRESPAHRVTISEEFAVGVYEVTVGEYRTFLEDTTYSGENSCNALTQNGWKKFVGRGWRSPGFSQTEQHPVVCVSWDDTQAYVRWLSTKTRKRYRLLSESEWEYVARAGTRTARYWGEDASDQCRYANGGDKTLKAQGYSVWLPYQKDFASCRDGYAHTSPVGSYEKNGFGLYDVLGNVSEWVEDCWNNSYEGAPSDGSPWTNEGDCSMRMTRGGSWWIRRWFMSSTQRGARSAIPPTDAGGLRSFGVGFRIARTLD